jgi:hypothetical protein
LKILTLVLQNAIRIIGVIVIVLGFLFWTHHSYQLIPVHRQLGIALVVLLWILAVIAVSARISSGFVIRVILWGVIVLVFGVTMGRMLPGRAHEIVRVVHFLLGLGAIGMAEVLAGRIKRSWRAGA